MIMWTRLFYSKLGIGRSMTSMHIAGYNIIMIAFFSKLETRILDIDSFLCVGLDPHPNELLESTGAATKEFCTRIINATAKKLKMSTDHVVMTVNKHCNTSAASVPLALYTAVRDGRIQRGETLLLEAFGGGFTWGAEIIRW